jgi:hypothetical protein
LSGVSVPRKGKRSRVGDERGNEQRYALPKTIQRKGEGAGAIVGFANALLRLYDVERPRAVLVRWDTLEDQPSGAKRRFCKSLEAGAS